MVARHWNHRWVRFFVAAAALLAVGWSVAPAATATELDKLDTALKLVPEDAAFYSSMMRNREQFDILRKSNAWTKVEQMPVVQMGLMMYQMQLDVPGSGPAKLNAALEHPEVRKVIDMVTDMVSHDIFMYGDDSWIDFLQLAQNVAGAMRYGPMMMQVTGQAETFNPNHIQAQIAISALADNVDLIGMPNFIVGFRVKNAELAKEQLIKIEMFGNMLEVNEKTKGHFKKTTVGGHDCLVLDLDGSMVPWDELPMDELYEMELEEGQIDAILEKLAESKLVIALGLRDNYLLCSVGSSLECLENFGQSKRLIDREEFKPLEKYADRRIVSIGYLSEAMNRQMNNQAQNIDELLKAADKLLPLANLTEEEQDQARADIDELADDFKGLIPEFGATSGIGLLSDRGIENYSYNWGKLGRLDGSKPLGLLQHVGGDPILGIVARSKMSMDDYDMMTEWATTAYGYFERFALPQIPEDDREKITTLLDAALPLIVRMDKANREMLIPALADGQSALVIDAKLQSKQFHTALPATEEPMPMFEPALVLGVSDAKLLKQGLGEYRAVINGLIDAVRQLEDTDVPPEIEIPEPQTTEGPQGTIYSFPLPKEWGVDEQIVPNVGVSNNAAVFSMSLGQTDRILKATPPTVGGVLEKTDRPLAMAAWLDWAALVDAATPWVDFAIEQATASDGIDGAQRKSITEQVHTGLDVLKTLRSITSEIYQEDGVMVSHVLLEIRDVEN